MTWLAVRIMVAVSARQMRPVAGWRGLAATVTIERAACSTTLAN
jgi:hypothetical protein